MRGERFRGRKFTSRRDPSKKESSSHRDKEKWEEKRDLTCFKCKKPGHIKYDCPIYKSEAKRRMKKAMMATWSESEESFEEENEKEVANMCFMAIDDLDEGSKKDKWLLDSGCSRHMTGDESKFAFLTKRKGGYVTFGDNSKGRIIGQGNIDLKGKLQIEDRRQQEEVVEDPKKEESPLFEMSMMGELNFFLGLQIKQLKEGTFINQAKYIKDLLKRFNMEKAKTMKTPMSSSIKFDMDEKGKPVNSTISQQSNALNGLQIGVEMKKLEPMETDHSKLKANFEATEITLRNHFDHLVLIPSEDQNQGHQLGMHESNGAVAGEGIGIGFENHGSYAEDRHSHHGHRDNPNAFRSMRDRMHPPRMSVPSCIVPPIEQLVIRPYIVPLLPTFHGMESENPYAHIKEFEEAKEYSYLVFPTHRTNGLKRQISNFSAKENEKFYECWERYMEAINACPHHGFDSWLLVSYFYDGIKNPEEAMDFLGYVAEVSRGWDEPNKGEVGKMKSQPNTSNAKAGMYTLNEDVDMKAKFAAMIRRLEELELKRCMKCKCC
ncbi:hypothetical protein AAG906_003148 [Vitis piasezkii]